MPRPGGGAEAAGARRLGLRDVSEPRCVRDGQALIPPMFLLIALRKTRSNRSRLTPLKLAP